MRGFRRQVGTRVLRITSLRMRDARSRRRARAARSPRQAHTGRRDSRRGSHFRRQTTAMSREAALEAVLHRRSPRRCRVRRADHRQEVCQHAPQRHLRWRPAHNTDDHRKAVQGSAHCTGLANHCANKTRWKAGDAWTDQGSLRWRSTGYPARTSLRWTHRDAACRPHNLAKHPLQPGQIRARTAGHGPGAAGCYRELCVLIPSDSRQRRPHSSGPGAGSATLPRSSCRGGLPGR